MLTQEYIAEKYIKDLKKKDEKYSATGQTKLLQYPTITRGSK